MLIVVRTPLRVSFVGGGTDLPSFCSKTRGAVISTTINSFIDIIIRGGKDTLIRQFKIHYNNKVECFPDVDSISHPIIRECFKFLKISEPLEIHSLADLPSGMGLGSSSAFTVGLLNGLYAYLGKAISWQRLAEESYYIEAEVLKAPIGRQDQYIAAHGGLCQIWFNVDGSVEIERLKCCYEKIKLLEKHTVLVPIGGQRTATSVLKNINPGKNDAQHQILTRLKQLCHPLREELENEAKIEKIGKILNESWLIKKSLSKQITSHVIDELYISFLDNGAVGGKLLGAGGSGFMLLFLNTEVANNKFNFLRGNLSYVPLKFHHQGSHILYASD